MYDQKQKNLHNRIMRKNVDTPIGISVDPF
jgi:hypothetical protein